MPNKQCRQNGGGSSLSIFRKKITRYRPPLIRALCEPITKGTLMKYNHVGIPVTKNFDGEIDLPHLKMTVSDHKNNPYGIQLQRYWDGAPYPDLVKTIPHVAFIVENIQAELAGKNVIIEPNSPSEGLIVAFIEVNGAPVELMEYT